MLVPADFVVGFFACVMPVVLLVAIMWADREPRVKP